VHGRARSRPVYAPSTQSPQPTCTPLPHYNQFLLTPNQTDRIEVVLVAPRNPLNIGAAARAMANFGFSRLAVVAPYAPHWREARSAIGAPQLLQDAVESLTLAEALAQSRLVVGTGTLTYRKAEQPVIPLPVLAPLVGGELERGGRMALVFGPEKHGLTREDLSYCHLLVEIPTDARQPSMNLGQAVAVCLYELASRAFPAPAFEPGAAQLPENDQFRGPATSSASLDLLAGLVEQTMTAAGYSPSTMQAANRHDLRLLLRRLGPTERDTRRILGLFRRVLWRLNHTPKGAEPGT
jgi:TrmH family RNA methyltransferase